MIEKLENRFSNINIKDEISGFVRELLRRQIKDLEELNPRGSENLLQIIVADG